MKVALLTSIGKSFKNNGDGRYVFELSNKVNHIGRKDLELVVISPNYQLSLMLGAIYNIFFLPLRLLFNNADIYHATSPGESIAPILLGRKTIVTLHDVIYLTYPYKTRFLQRLYFRFCC